MAVVYKHTKSGKERRYGKPNPALERSKVWERVEEKPASERVSPAADGGKPKT